MSNVDFHWGVKISARDGIHLNATVYTPKDQRAPAPCILTLTPYISDSVHERGVYFAAHGYPFVIVDVRGRGNSEGVFRPLIQEAQDGYDVVEWLAKQPYCNTQVAMWGGSYAGYAQWATAKEFPPHLATIVPAAAAYAGVDFPMRNNIFQPYAIQWLTYTSGRASQRNIFTDDAFWSTVYRTWHQSGRPFRELDRMAGNPSEIFQEWLSHPELDDYWDAYNPTAEQQARLQIPILTITGIYDDDQAGALEHYQRHMRNAPPAASARHYLVIGPWDHAGTRTPQPEFGGMKFGPASLVDLPKLHLEWYAWALQNGPRPAFLQKRVAYYVMGAERWRYSDTLDGITARYEPWFLDSTGSGSPDAYVFDPREMHGPALVYHSAPFEREIEISGFFKLHCWIAIDCPDTDFYASVYEIDLDGQCKLLSTDGIRARYRQGLRNASLITTPEPLRYDFERFTFVSCQIKRGHHLRLVIAPVGRLIDASFTERNYNAGGTVAEESMKDARPVTVRLFHDESHPGALYIPYGHAET